jgi:hypothetical protein
VLRHRHPGPLGLATVAVAAALVAIAIPRTSTVPPPSPSPHPAAVATAADGMRNAALASRDRARDAASTLRHRLAHCLPDDQLQGRALERFWTCANVAIRQQVMRGRVEAHLLAQVVGGIPGGACRDAVGALGAMHAGLGAVAYDTQLALQEALYRPAPHESRRAVRTLRLAAREISRLVRSGAWRACKRPIPAM